MGKRERNLDCKRPFYYMVTLRRREGVSAFSSIDAHGVVENEITQAFDTVIKNFHHQWFAIEPNRSYVIMPDHIHLLIKLAKIEKPLSLAVIVRQLMRALARAYAALPNNYPLPPLSDERPKAPGRSESATIKASLSSLFSSASGMI